MRDQKQRDWDAGWGQMACGFAFLSLVAAPLLSVVGLWLIGKSFVWGLLAAPIGIAVAFAPLAGDSLSKRWPRATDPLQTITGLLMLASPLIGAIVVVFLAPG